MGWLGTRTQYFSFVLNNVYDKFGADMSNGMKQIWKKNDFKKWVENIDTRYQSIRFRRIWASLAKILPSNHVQQFWLRISRVFFSFTRRIPGCYLKSRPCPIPTPSQPESDIPKGNKFNSIQSFQRHFNHPFTPWDSWEFFNHGQRRGITMSFLLATLSRELKKISKTGEKLKKLTNPNNLF